MNTEINSVNQKISSLIGRGQYREAAPLLEQAVELGRIEHGEDNPQYAASLNDLGGLYGTIGQYQKSEDVFVKAPEPLYREALEICSRAFGREHPDYASTMTNLGLLYDKMGDKDSAEECYSEALELRGQIYSESHPRYIVVAQLPISFYEKTDRGVKATALRQRIGGNAAE